MEAQYIHLVWIEKELEFHVMDDQFYLYLFCRFDHAEVYMTSHLKGSPQGPSLSLAFFCCSSWAKAADSVAGALLPLTWAASCFGPV